MKRIVIIFMLLNVAFSACGQLNFNAKRIAQDTIRARSTSQGGSTGRLELPYEYSGLFPSIAVNDTLLHEWIQKNGVVGQTLIEGNGIEFIGDSVQIGGLTTKDIILETQLNDFVINTASLSNITGRFVVRSDVSGIIDSLVFGGDDTGFVVDVGATGSSSSSGIRLSINNRVSGGFILEDMSSNGNDQFIIRRGGEDFNEWLLEDLRPNPRGIEYALSGYETNFSDSSLVTKLYVDSQVGGSFWKTDANFTVTETLSNTINEGKFFSMIDSDSPKRFLFNNGISSSGSISMSSDSTGSTGFGLSISNTNARMIGVDIGNLEVASTGLDFKFTDLRTVGLQEGIVYDADYSADYVVRSIVDKGYSDSYFTGSVTDGTPTDAEIDAILGTPVTVGVGYKAVIKDSDGTGLMYTVFTDGTGWYWNITTLAL